MAITPTRKYETLGHAAPGKGVNEYAAGFEVGHHAISISPSLFVSAGYKYSYVERIDDLVSVDRSNAEFHVDYLLTSRVALRASTMWQHTHGGLDLPLTGPAAAQHAHHHDQLARSNFWHGSLGISYGLTPTLDVSQVPLLERRDRLAFDRSSWHRERKKTVASQGRVERRGRRS